MLAAEKCRIKINLGGIVCTGSGVLTWEAQRITDCNLGTYA